MTNCDYYSQDSVAEKLGVTRRKLDKWRRARQGPAFVKFGSLVMYPIREFESWQRAQIQHTRDTAGLQATATTSASAASQEHLQ